MATVYFSVFRLILKYACPVWHTKLPQYLYDNIKMIEKRALKCFVLYWVSLRHSGVLTQIR